MQSEGRNKRKTRKGTVVSNKMDKTVVVSVTRVVRHPRYGKVVKLHKKYYAHNDGEPLNIGDEVTITETRPLSKTKRWRVVAA
ncbi:MAG: 30S ribosomal protein S17 [Chlamydiota bacterium]|nr:30S ribosomal protein S17 [Chlamydiota bacterium]